MPKSPLKLARQLLASEKAGLEALRTHEFQDDGSAHDDAATEKLFAKFATAFDRVQAELTRTFGEPARTGSEEDKVIPLNGVFRFAVWEVEGRLLFASAHEDRGVPILLILGTASNGVKRRRTVRTS